MKLQIRGDENESQVSLTLDRATLHLQLPCLSLGIFSAGDGVADQFWIQPS